MAYLIVVFILSELGVIHPNPWTVVFRWIRWVLFIILKCVGGSRPTHRDNRWVLGFPFTRHAFHFFFFYPFKKPCSFLTYQRERQRQAAPLNPCPYNF
jgi:hypothetical protein